MMFKKYIFLSLAISFLAFGCDEDRELVTVKLGDAAAITTPDDGASVDITEDNLGDAFPTITWTVAEFGFAAAVDYTVEMDVANDNFAAPVSLGSSTAFELKLTNGEVNNVMITKGLPGGVFTSMQVRVVANAGEQLEQLISEPITINISPFEVELEPLVLQVPGSYQGWSPEDTETVIYSPDRDDQYDGYRYFEDATQFKFAQGYSWDTNWGDTGADGTLDPGGDNIEAIEGEGLYRLTVDLPGLTFTATKTNWAIIGGATPNGWDNDTDMAYDQMTGLYTIDLDLMGGEAIKFRANDAWDVNLGDDNGDGKMEYGGADITVAEDGNYTITLDLTTPRYGYTLEKN